MAIVHCIYLRKIYFPIEPPVRLAKLQWALLQLLCFAYYLGGVPTAMF